jgi:replicative DNA helicase
VSIAHLGLSGDIPPEDAWGGDRTPPHDLLAEQYTLGAMMLSKAAIDDVLEVVQGRDFYIPKHEVVFDAMTALVAAGDPVDVITVADALTKTGLLQRAGGAEYLHTLTGIPSTTANAGYHAEIVSKNAILRRLVEAGTRVVQMGYASEGEPIDLVANAQAELDEVLSARRHTARPIGATIDATFTSLETPATYIPTPWASIDKMIGGFAPGSLYVVAARPGEGKALDLNTEIPTPTGWTTMGELQVGDWVLGRDGNPARVTAATEVQHDRECFEVELSDHTTVIADADHRWLTDTRASRLGRELGDQVRTTREILATLRVGTEERVNHSIAVAAPVDLPDADLPIDPYVFGYWLGDGTSRTSVLSVGAQDLEYVRGMLTERGFHIDTKVDQSAFRIRFSTSPIGHDSTKDSATKRLRLLGVIGGKHIPEIYLRASRRQREELLAGMLDSDGTVNAPGNVEYVTTSARIQEGFAELVASLGIQLRQTTKIVAGRDEARSIARVSKFTPDRQVFRMPRKAVRLNLTPRPTNLHRYIVDIRPVPSRPVRCITVASPDHTYLVTRSFVPTHNTNWVLQAATSLARVGVVAFSSLEMQESELHVRLFSQFGDVSMTSLRRHSLIEDEWIRTARALKSLRDAPIFIDESEQATVASVAAHARAVGRKGQLAGIVVDYLQLLDGEGQDRRVVVDKIAQSLKQLAKRLHVPVIAAAQLSRGERGRGKERPLPTLRDLREAGGIEQAADVVLLLHRDAERRPHALRVIAAKNRHGTTGVVTLHWAGEFSRMEDRRWSPTTLYDDEVE